MPKFNIIVTRVVQYNDTVEFEISAKNEEEARKKALIEAEDFDDWDEGIGEFITYEVDLEEVT